MPIKIIIFKIKNLVKWKNELNPLVKEFNEFLDIINKEKEFKKNVKGYDPLEVDEFLDKVLQDYRIIDDVVINLNNKVEPITLEDVLLAASMSFQCIRNMII